MSGAEEYDDPGHLVRQIDDDIGKGLFATRDYSAGETIFREAPLVSCQFAWNQAYGYAACHFCLEPLETAQTNAARLAADANVILPNPECCTTRSAFHVPCPNCAVVYCSSGCLEEAWGRWHKTLCLGSPSPDPAHPFVQVVELWKTFHYPPETVSIVLLARLLASVVQAEDPDAEIQKYMSFMHQTVNDREEIGHKMLGENFSSQLEQLRQAFLVLFPQPVLHSLTSPDGFVALFALVGRNGQGIGTSPFSQWIKKVEKLSVSAAEKKHTDDLIDRIYEAMDEHAGHFLDNEGSGLFLRQSAINHSCVPNAQVEFPFNSHELVVNATKAVHPGEEILISYLGEGFSDRSRHSRQKELRENYLFVCKCQRCQEQRDDPDVTSEEEMSAEEEEEEEAS